MKTRLTIAILAAMAVAANSLAQTVDTAMSGGVSEPYGIAIDSSTTNNYFYVTDSIGGRVVRYAPATGEQVDLTQHIFSSPQGIAMVGGKLAVADYGRHVISIVELNGTVSTVVGTGDRGLVDGPAASAQFDFPSGIATDSSGRIYVADSKNNKIRRIDGAFNVTTFGPSTNLLGPEGVAVDDSGRVFVADTRNHVIRMISADGSTITTIAGEFGVPGSFIGFGSSSRFNFPKGLLWIGGETGLLVADTQNHVIRRVFQRPADGAWLVAAYAGISGVHGFDNGAAATATFFEPTGLAKDVSGLLLIVDLKNDAVRRIVRPTVTTAVFDFPGGSFSNTVSIKITNDKDIVPTNSVYRYTLDGSDPVSSSAVFPRSGSVAIVPTAASTNVIFKVRGTSPDAMSGTLVSNTFSFFVNPLNVNITSGSFTNDIRLTNNTLTAAASIRYTVDGSAPTELSPSWVDGAWGRSGPLVVRGFRDGFAPSVLLSNTYTFNVATPIVNREDGVYFNAMAVTMSSGTTGAELRYTLDGSEPTSGSTLYTEGDAGFQLASNSATPGNRVVRVKGFKNGYVTSEEVRRTYTFNVATPTIDVAGGSFTNNVDVNIDTETTGETIRFTTNGSVPTESDPVWVNGSFGTDGPLLVRAFRTGFNPSTVISNKFNFTVAAPTIDVASGTYSNDVVITVTGGTTGANYHYTFDGTTPTGASPSVTSGGTITNRVNAIGGTNSVLKVVGIKAGYVNSAVVQATYALTCDAPVVSVAGGSFINNTNVTVTTRTAGATITYTTDGTAPTISSTPWVDGSFGIDGTLKIGVFKAGYNGSAAYSGAFSFTVDAPTISVASGTFNETFLVSLTNQTAGTAFYYTTDGSTPTPASSSISSGGTIAITTNSVPGTGTTLKVLPHKVSYAAAAVLTRSYVLKVGTPVVSVPGGSFFNDTNVTVTVPGTTNTTVTFTTTGADPLVGGAVWPDGPFGTDGTLKVRAFRDGFLESDIVANGFTFTVATPSITPGTTNAINVLTATATTSTTGGAVLYYTTDGTSPTASSTLVAGAITVRENTQLRVIGIKPGYRNSAVASADYQIQIDAPAMNPNTGFYQDGATVTLSVARAGGANIHYSVSGVDPTESDPTYSAPFRLSQGDLAKLRARAYLPNTVPSAVTAFTLSVGSTNTIGVSRDVSAGPGSSVVVPVVVNLATNQVLRSLQFRVEVWPDSGATNLTSDLRAQGFSTNDFVIVSSGNTAGAATGTYSTYRTSGGGVTTNGMTITFIATNANLNLSGFGTVALVVVPLPATAQVGHQYKIRTLFPSGTSDANQQSVPIGSLDPRTIKVEQLRYIVGDTALGRWYNAGDFGDGDLDNADVNAAFYASLGVKVPYAFTDAFDAMDAYPDDTANSVGGDGQIRFLDWQRILDRSLRRSTNNWERYWSTNGVRVATNATLKVRSPDSPTHPFASGVTASIVNPAAQLYGAAISQVTPSSVVRMPVRLKVAPGYAITGLQFRGIVEPVNNAPAVTAPVLFEPANGLPLPLQATGLAANQTTAAWSELVNPLVAAWQGDNLLGHVSFAVPSTATAGSQYRVRFVNADGAPNLHTQYDVETQQGVVGVQSAAVPQSKIVAGLRLSWFGLLGQRYVVESIPDVLSDTWQVESPEISGQGRQQEFIDQNPGTATKFYRVRLIQ
jgi:hypothetical protein